MAAAIAVAAVVLVKNGTGRARDGVLFGLYLTCALAAILAIAESLGVWEGWIMIAVVVPILAVQWLRSRHRQDSPA